MSIFLDDAQGRRPVFGDVELFQSDPDWHDLLPFHEYLHGDPGRGLGASHQTGCPDWWPTSFSGCSHEGRAEPYTYVSPHAPRRGPFWDRLFGAARVVHALDDVDAIVEFFEAGRAAAAGTSR